MNQNDVINILTTFKDDVIKMDMTIYLSIAPRNFQNFFNYFLLVLKELSERIIKCSTLTSPKLPLILELVSV